MDQSFTFVIMGATGDLAKLRLIPAIYMLLKLNTVSRVAIVGVARSEATIRSILDEAKKNIKNVDEAVWTKLCQSAYYQKLDFTQTADFEVLKNKIEEIEKKENLSGNRLFYLATLPEHFESASTNLAKVDLVNVKDNKWERVLYEKPFGDSLHSAKKINKEIENADINIVVPNDLHDPLIISQ